LVESKNFAHHLGLIIRPLLDSDGLGVVLRVWVSCALRDRLVKPTTQNLPGIRGEGFGPAADFVK